LTEVDAEIRIIWPSLAGAGWFPVISDGFASNVGAGAVDESAIAASVATSGAMRVLVHQIPDEIPSGLWCYRVDASRALLGGAVNDVGRVVSWLESTVPLRPGDDVNVFLAAPPDPSHRRAASPGSAALGGPNLGGLRGVSSATTGAMLFRGAMEGVAIMYARIADQLRRVAGQPQRILASGRVTQDLPDWLQLLSDVLGAPVIPVTIKRATLRGTALIALEVLAPGVTERRPRPATLVSQRATAAYYSARMLQYRMTLIAVRNVPSHSAGGDLVGPASSLPRRQLLAVVRRCSGP
jgi:gluconokinase